MKLTPIVMVLGLAALNATAQEEAAPAPAPALNENEARFEKLMSGCRMVGSFTTAGPLKPPETDGYTIRRVVKVGEDRWKFEAKIDYGRRGLVIPVTVDVKWAGDTPMIQVTDLTIPMLGTFSARVLVYGDGYAGTWKHGDRRGHMWGRIERAPEEPAPREEKAAAPDIHWPSFRGRFARGVAEGYEPPVEWDVVQGKNVHWRTAIPGLSHASPVIWGDRIFVVTAVAEGPSELKIGLYGDIGSVEDERPHQFQVLALDRKDGKVLWTRTAFEGVPAVKRHPKSTHAASTPATDGQHVVAFFGSEGLHCYDLGGGLKWKKDFGVLDSGYYVVPTAQWGFASSPVIHEGRVIIQCDVQKGGFLAALDVATGNEIWRTPRDDVPGWSTPTVNVEKDRRQVIVNGFKHMGGYDLDTGKELWRIGPGGDIPVPTPVVAHGLVFLTNAHGRLAPILAVSTLAEGTLSLDPKASAFVAWGHERRGNYMQTPIVYGDELFCCNDAGILSGYEARTGELIYRERLGEGRSGFTGSGVAGGGRLYFTSEEGDVHVVVAGRTFRKLSVNPLGEECLSTPALSEGTLYYRTRGHLVAIGSER